MKTRTAPRRIALLVVGAIALAGVTASLPVAAAGDDDEGRSDRRVELRADLDPLNNSGAQGHAKAHVARNGKMTVAFRATGLLADAPHAVHVHFGRQARHECPSTVDDSNRDFRLTTVEGVPAYGPVNISLTTRGDFSPESILAIDRFPVANDDGNVKYRRSGLRATDQKALNAIKNGKGVVVIHGLDYNANGKYDMAGAGESELADGVPAEATDPALCGTLEHHR